MSLVFIDSDVIIDYLYDRQPFSKSAIKLLDACASNKIKGYVSPLIIANVYYVLRKTCNHDEVISRIKELVGFLDVVKMNKQIVLNALNSDFNDFEDALQNFSVVEHAEINIIITRNVKDYKHSVLSVYDPESFLKTFN